MRRRAALLGATLSVGTGPHGGTEVRLEVAGA
jgi:signal transduction histidine kinase